MLTVSRSSHRELRSFLTQFVAYYRALQSLGQPSADTLLIHLCLSRLDTETTIMWREHSCSISFPDVQRVFDFLHERCNHLELSVPRESDPRYPTKGTKPTRVYATQLGVKCGLCDQGHFIHTCEQFLDSSPSERIKIIRERRLCTNCLRKGHTPAKCRAGTCRVCQRRHHSLLYADSITDQDSPQVNTTCLKT